MSAGQCGGEPRLSDALIGLFLGMKRRWAESEFPFRLLERGLFSSAFSHMENCGFILPTRCRLTFLHQTMEKFKHEK